jgi:hypothetical protein
MSENQASSSKDLVALEPEPSQISEAGVLPETTGTPTPPHTLETQASGTPVVLYDPRQATDAPNWLRRSRAVVNPKITWVYGDVVEFELPFDRILYDVEAVSKFPGIKAAVPINGYTKAPGDTELREVTQLFCHKSIHKDFRDSLASTGVSMTEFSEWEEIKSHIGHFQSNTNI